MTILILVLTLASTLVLSAASAAEDCDQSSACSGGRGHQTTPASVSGNQLIYQYEMSYFRAVLEDAAQRCSTIGKRMQAVANPSCGGPHRVYGCPYCPLEQDCVATFECM